jgi:hypothetical protein
MIYIEGTQVADDSLPMVLWDNFYARGTITASSQTSDGAAANAAEETTYDYWTPSSSTATLQVTLSSAEAANCCAIAAHNLADTGSTVSVQYLAGSWVTLGSVTPTTNDPLMIVFNETTDTHFRISITGSSAPSIGVVFLGKRLTFSTGVALPYTPIWQSQKVDLLQSVSLGGQFMGNRVNRRGGTGGLTLNVLERDFIEGANFQAFKTHYDNGKAFFFASSPADYPEDLAYVWRSPNNTMRPTFANNGLFYQVNMSLEAYVE